jgi:hypothetical protein
MIATDTYDNCYLLGYGFMTFFIPLEWISFLTSFLSWFFGKGGSEPPTFCMFRHSFASFI